MIYEKPEISFQKFDTDTFLDDKDVLSANNPESEWEWDPEGGFEFGGVFNGYISLDPDGTGGWFNG